MKSVCDHLKEDLALSEGHSARLLRSLRKVIHCGSAKVSMSLCPLRQGSDSAMLARADAPVLRTQRNRQSFDCPFWLFLRKYGSPHWTLFATFSMHRRRR